MFDTSDDVIHVSETSAFDVQKRYLLRRGDVTLFLASVDENQRIGRRTRVVTWAAPAFISMPTAPSGYAWVLSHHATSEIVEETQGSADETSLAVQSTVSQLLDVIRPHALPPGDRVKRLGVRPTFVSEGRSALVSELSWVRPIEGEPRLADVLLPAGGAPVAERMSVVAHGFSALTAVPFSETSLSEQCDGAAWLCGVAGKVVLDSFELREDDDRTRAINDPKLSAASELNGVQLLVRAIETRGRGTHISSNADPLIRIAETVASVDGFSINVPRGGLRGREGTAAVRALATTSGLYVRTVTLPNDWHVEISQPMIGFSKNGSPLALVSKNGRGIVVDSDGNEMLPADADLIDNAFVFSRPPIGEGLTRGMLLKDAFAGEGREVARVVLWALVMVLVSLTIPLASGVVFGEIIPEGDRTRLGWLIFSLVVAAVAVLPIQVAQTAASSRLEASVSLKLQRGIWGRVLRSPVGLVKRLGPGDLVMRLASLEMARDPLEQAVISALPVMFGSVLSVVILFIYMPVLAVISVIWGLIVLVSSLYFAVRVAGAQKSVDQATGNVNGFLYQVLGAIPKLRVAGAESRAFAAWAARFQGAVGQDLTIRTAHQILFGSLVATLSTVVLFSGVVLTDSGKDVGAFIAFQTTFGLFMSGISAFVGGIAVVLQMAPAMGRATELVSDILESGEGRSDPGVLTGAISLRSVTFRYQPDSPPVLHELDLNIQAGEMVAVVGHSGCGKSTLLRILLGFESPEQGSILFDDQDLSSLDVESVRRQLGVVLQDGQLMPGTIRQNLAGAVTLSDDDAWELAETVALADDIRAMPMQLETMITLNGGAFSGGQRQRILIARALAARPRVLLLDEATSALDNVTQRVVTDNLSELGMTRIIVAHRLSTIVSADRIVVFDSGKVAEQGTYDELMSRNGIFYSLATRQIV